MPSPISALGVSPLRQRPFTLFWLARTCTVLGFQIQSVAIGWQMYDLTRNPWDLGMVGLAQFLPALLLALPAGHVVDRYPRRTVWLVSLAVQFLTALAFCLGSAQGWLTAPMIYGIAGVFGGARVFNMPVMQSVLPGLVPRESLGQAVAWSSSVGQAATIIGPALGGLLYGLGPVSAYAACVGAHLVCMSLVTALPKVSAASVEKPSFASVFAGIRFIASERAVLGAITLDLFAVLLGGATALLPIYARDILVTGPIGLGLLRSSTAIGALTIGLALARWPLQHYAGRVLFGTVALFGFATCVFAVSTNFSLSVLALMVLGGSDMISVYIRATLVQLRTPDAMRGRVSAVNAIFIGTSNQLGEFESGATAAWLGTVPAVLVGGLGTLAVVGLGLLLFPELRRVDKLDERA